MYFKKNRKMNGFVVKSPKINEEANKVIIDEEEQRVLEIIKSDYSTDSEFDPEFQSDNEPPQDKIQEERLVVKKDKFRIYKSIIRIGKKMHMPSKYDKIVYRFKDLEAPATLEDVFTEQDPKIYAQMGISPDIDGEILYGLQSMKKGEIGGFKVEFIHYDKKKHKRILAKERYFLLELLEWETIIDIFGDFLTMKHISTRGVGYKRFNSYDEVAFTLKLKNLKSSEILLDLEIKEPRMLKKDELDSPILEILHSMKQEEECWIEIKPRYFLEKKDKLSEKLTKNLESLNSSDHDEYVYSLEVSLQEILGIDDIFRDQTVLFKSETKTYSTAQPSKHSRIYFALKITLSDGRVAYDNFTSLERPPISKEDDFEFYEHFGCEKAFIDCYYFSQALTGSLELSKKYQKGKIIISDPKRITYGRDLRLINKFLEKENNEALQSNLFPITYDIFVHTFSIGDNAFSMGVEDKKKCYADRKPVIVKMLKKKDYVKALTLLEFLNDILEKGDEEKAELKDLRTSCFLNLSLCYWKLGNWKKMREASKKLLDKLDPLHFKAWYRYLTAQYHLTEFEEVIEKVSELSQDFNKNNEKKFEEEYPEFLKLQKKAKSDLEKVKLKEKKMFTGLFS